MQACLGLMFTPSPKQKSYVALLIFLLATFPFYLFCLLPYMSRMLFTLQYRCVDVNNVEFGKGEDREKKKKMKTRKMLNCFLRASGCGATGKLKNWKSVILGDE